MVVSGPQPDGPSSPAYLIHHALRHFELPVPMVYPDCEPAKVQDSLSFVAVRMAVGVVGHQLHDLNALNETLQCYKPRLPGDSSLAILRVGSIGHGSKCRGQAEQYQILSHTLFSGHFVEILAFSF